MDCIVYWQAKEIVLIVNTFADQLDDFMVEMIAHISPVGWDNLILYGAQQRFNQMIFLLA